MKRMAMAVLAAWVLAVTSGGMIGCEEKRDIHYQKNVQTAPTVTEQHEMVTP